MKSKDLFPAVFSRHAQAYASRHDEIWRQGKNGSRLAVIDRIAARPGIRVLDLACGPGDIAARVLRKIQPAGEVIGADLAEGMLEIARARVPGARFVRMDIEQLGFPDECFDAVTCGHGYQFVPDLGRALREGHRVLRGGGRLAASVPAEVVGSRMGELLERALDRRLPPALRPADSDLTRRIVGDANALRRLALDAGFVHAEASQVEEKVHYRDPQELVSNSMGWWSTAMRLESLPADRREQLLREVVAELETSSGGPIEIPTRSTVLVARR